MSDLVNRLRALAPELTAPILRMGGDESPVTALVRKAADRIEALEAALRPFATDTPPAHSGDICDVYLLPENTRVKIMRQSPPHWYFDHEVSGEITTADLRRARASLEQFLSRKDGNE